MDTYVFEIYYRPDENAGAIFHRFTFCHFPFVLSLVAKLKILKHDQERQMIRTARDELVASIKRSGEECAITLAL